MVGGAMLDEHGAHLGEPTIYLVPWCRVTKAIHKVTPFVIAVGPQDCASQESFVLPHRKRNTNLNGYWSRIFSAYFDKHRLELVRRSFAHRGGASVSYDDYTRCSPSSSLPHCG